MWAALCICIRPVVISSWTRTVWVPLQDKSEEQPGVIEETLEDEADSDAD